MLKLKSITSIKDKEYILCETTTAYAIHVREVGSRGPLFSGNYGTETLCGSKTGWDVKVPFILDNVGCPRCKKILEGLLNN